MRVHQAKRKPGGFTTAFSRFSPLVDFLEKYWLQFNLQLGSSTSMFPPSLHNSQNYIAASNIQQRLQVLVKSQGWPGRFGFHSCKLGATTEAIQAGLDPEEVRQLARWSDVRLVARYTRPDLLSYTKLSNKIFHHLN